MPNFEKNILGFIPQEEWLDMGFQVTRPNDPIDGLFGDDKTDNLVAAWETIATQYQIPVMAQFHGFDTEAQTTFRVPIDNHNIEKGLIKVKINQSERMRSLLRAGVRNDQMYDYVINDGVRLADQVVTRTKVAKNELMATGKVTIKENNLDLTVDYGVPTAQTQYVLNLSSTADIQGQIQQIIDDARDIGVVITGMLTSRKNILKMRQNAGLQTAINGNVGAGQLIRSSSLEAFLAEEFGINQVIVNDLTYGASSSIGSDGRPSIVTKRYFPEDKVTFFATNPSGRMGIGLWGNPPEVDAGQIMEVGASGVSPYVYISQWQETDPAVLWTKASALFMPVIYNPNALFIASVDDSFLNDLTVSPENSAVSIYNTPVSSLQTGVSVTGNKFSGTLKYYDTAGEIVDHWGAGNFLAFKVSGEDSNTVSTLVGLEPSRGTGLVEIHGDADMNGIAKIDDAKEQKFKVVQTDSAGHKNIQYYDLSGLTLETE